MPPVVQLQESRAPGDCAVVALANFLNIPYEDVLAAAVTTTQSGRVHYNGMLTREIKATAKKLGVVLRLRRGFDLETDEGVLSLNGGAEQHAVLLRAGLIWDGDRSAWEPDDYLSEQGYRPISLLVRTHE